MSNASDFVIENGVLKKYKGSGRYIVTLDSSLMDESWYLDEGTQIATTVFRGYFDEVAQVIDYLSGREEPMYVSGNIYEYWTSAIEIPKLKQALQQVPSLKVAMFVEFWSSRAVYMFYSPSGCPFVTNDFYAGGCDFHAEERWCWTHLPTEAHFKETALNLQTGEMMRINYHFPMKDDWEADNYITDRIIVTRDNLTSIVIPKGVTGIDDSAFRDSKAVVSITIPEGVVIIGEKTFSGCDNLRSITIPDSVNSIGDSAFQNCSTLTSITIPKGVVRIGEKVFFGCANLKDIRIPESVTEICADAFSGCSSLEDIIIPDSVTSIGNSAFYYCISMTNFTTPNRLIHIGEKVFSGCCNLKSIEIPESVAEIGADAFSGCSSLKSIKIPHSVTSIGSRAFKGCSNLTHAIIPESVVYLGDSVFGECKNLTNLTIPESLRSTGDFEIENGVLKKYTGFRENVVIPDDVTSIGDGAFKNCNGLTCVTIPKSVIHIGNSAFEYCKKLMNVAIPARVISIGRKAFKDCSNLTSISIPDSVTSIGVWAFFGCSSLKNIAWPSALAKELQDHISAEKNSIILHIGDISNVSTKYRPSAAVGFAEDERNRTDENGKKYLKYIKSNAAKLASYAIEHPALLHLMIREKLITAKDLEAVTAAVQKSGNAELIAAILNYENFSISEKGKAKL